MINAQEILVKRWIDGLMTSEDLEKEIAYHLEKCRRKDNA